MRRVAAIVAAGMAITLAGCVLAGKPGTVAATPVAPTPSVTPPPAPPPKLSIPQTHADLPPPQPIDPAALALAPAGPATTPAPPRQPGRGGRGSQSTPAPRQDVGPAGPATPPVPPSAEPEPRPRISEIVPTDVQKQLQEQAQSLQREVRAKLEQLGNRPLTTRQRRTKTSIESFLKMSGEAEGRADWRTAKELAGRAQVLLKELPQ